MAFSTILLVLLVLQGEVLSSEFNYCPSDVKEDSPLRWSRELGDMDYACKGPSKSLYCCAAGFTNLTWYQKSRDSDTWDPFPPTDWINRENGYRLLDRNVTLLISSVHTKDDAWYRCVAEGDDGRNITHELKLNAVSCSGITDPPTVTFPPKDKITKGYRIVKQTLPGENVTLFCEGFLGRDNASSTPNVIRWLTNFTTTANNDTIWRDVEDVGPRFSVTKEARYDNMILGAYLIVTDVQVEDYTKVFKCVMANGIDPQPTVLAHLVRTPPKPSAPNYWTRKQSVILSVSLVAAIILVVTVVVILVKYQVEIRLLWKDKFSHKQEDDKEHDAFVYVSQKCDRERLFVHRKLRPKLEGEFKYKIIIEARDFRCGESIPTLLDNAVSSSRCFIIVLSRAMLEEPYFDFIFHVAVKEHRRIVFILFEDIQDSEWEAYKKKNRDKELVQKALKVLKKLRWHPVDEEGGVSSQNIAKKNEMFWKKLRLYLPPQKIQKVRGNLTTSNRRPGQESTSSTSAHCPLISSTNSHSLSCPTPSAIPIPVEIDDNVFFPPNDPDVTEIKVDIHSSTSPEHPDSTSHEIIDMNSIGSCPEGHQANPNQIMVDMKGEGQAKSEGQGHIGGHPEPQGLGKALDIPNANFQSMQSTDSGYEKSVSPQT